MTVIVIISRCLTFYATSGLSIKSQVSIGFENLAHLQSIENKRNPAHTLIWK